MLLSRSSSSSVVLVWALLTLALGAWACRERTLQVLEPATKAPAASNAPVAGAGAPNAGIPNPDAGTQPLPATSTCSTGAALGTECISSNDCCSGSCGPTPTGQLQCLPNVGCWGISVPCYSASDCCSLACVTRANGAACSDFGYCSSKGGTCSVNSDCCSSLCTGGICAESAPPPCLPAGELCSGATDCCGAVCALSGDGRTRCQLLLACRVVGEICAAAGDCCGGTCLTSPSGVARCGPAKACAMLDGKPCSRQAGDLCKTPDECCSRACVAQAAGGTRCAASAGCRSACEQCNLNHDCCSGACVVDADGLKRCTLGSCAAEGEICSKTDDCCQTAGAQKCVEEPTGQKYKRCRRDAPATECIADGDACALGSRCCSGVCAQNLAWEFRCVEGRVAEGQPCASLLDCAQPNSDCVSLFGERRCFVVVAP